MSIRFLAIMFVALCFCERAVSRLARAAVSALRKAAGDSASKSKEVFKTYGFKLSI